jgi:hypothetical protein
MEIDSSRLPRVEEYQPWMADLSSGFVVPPSDVKTIAYYVATDATSTGVVSPTTGQLEYGLVRREVDRATTVWAVNNGDTMALEPFAEILAPEVLAVEFFYFDAIEWLSDWDSAALGGLPFAIEVAVYMPLSDAGAATTPIDPLALSEAFANGQVERYSLIVPIPIARGPAQTEETTTEEGASSTSTGSTGTTITP